MSMEVRRGWWGTRAMSADVVESPRADLLCLCCGAEVVSTVPALQACPACGCDVHGPASIAERDMQTVRISAHELRILTFFAANWAARVDGEDRRPDVAHIVWAVQTIVDRLGQQTAVALTMSQEIADVRAEFPDAVVTVYRDGEVIDP